MGFSKWWMKHGLGSPASMAKTMAKCYLVNKANLPSFSNEQLLALTLESRIQAQFQAKKANALQPRDEEGRIITELELIQKHNWDLKELILHVAHCEISEVNNAYLNFPDLYQQLIEVLDEAVDKVLLKYGQGMLEDTAMDSGSTVIDCPICKQKLRIPAERSLQVNCPSCNSGFDYPINNYDTGCEFYEMQEEGEEDCDVETCKQLISINPNDVDAHIKLGQAYKRADMFAEAIEAYKQAISINPDHVEVYFNLGMAYSSSGMYEEAIESYKQDIRIDPDEAASHFCLGLAYSSSDMHKEAIEAYRQVIRINPDYTNAHNYLGLTYFESGMYEEAIESFEKAIALDPEEASYYNNLGKVQYMLELSVESVESYKKAIRIEPDHARAHFNLGVYYSSRNDRSSALEEYKILKGIDTELANELLDVIYE
jgi:tetratricopeptide (TPR) repeat protein